MSLDTTKILKKVKYNGVDFALNSEWQPDADMQWARSVFENDVQEGYTYKVLMMMDGYEAQSYITGYYNAGYSSPKVIKTSDGAVYNNSSSNFSITHTWDDSNAKQSKVGNYKVRWVIYYYETSNEVKVTSSDIIDTTKYICHNCKLYNYANKKYNLECIDALEDGDNIVGNDFNNLSNFKGLNKLTIPEGEDGGALFQNSGNIVYMPKEIKGKFTSLSYSFQNVKSLNKLPIINTTDVQNFNYAFYGMTLEEISGVDFKNGTNFQQAFAGLGSQFRKLTGVDFRSATSLGSIFNGLKSLTILDIKNINATLQIGSGNIGGSSSYGIYLTLDSLLNTIKELWDNTEGETTKTLTVGTANKNKLANVYVKLVDITDEMRAEDEFIDLKLPFVVCESTDEGAMLITDYATSKNWTIA